MPATVTDPTWSLQPWPVEVKLAGHLFEVPALTAADWLQVLFSEEMDLMDIFPGALPEEDQDLINEALFGGTITLDDLYDACLNVLATVAARPWWVALRLVATVRHSWQVLGAEMLMRGVNAGAMSLSGWLDVSLLLIMRNIDAKEATMFTLKLEQPPPGVSVEAPEPEMSPASFMSMA